jgi:hypothetical protein
VQGGLALLDLVWLAWEAFGGINGEGIYPGIGNLMFMGRIAFNESYSIKAGFLH